MKKKKKIRIGRLFITILVMAGLLYGSFLLLKSGYNYLFPRTTIAYLASDTNQIDIYDLEYNKTNSLVRGLEVTKYEKEYINNETTYYKIKYDGDKYMVNASSVVNEYKDIIKEKEVFIRTSATIYDSVDDVLINGLLKKGNIAKVIGFDKIDIDGNVNMYKIEYNDITGYVYAKYIVYTKEASLLNYDEEGTYQVHKSRGNTLGGGKASTLDYYPYQKANFENNPMPKEVRSLYLNSGVLGNLDAYIELAKANNINAFVVDVKENTVPAYKSEVMKSLSPTSYKKASYSVEKYKSYIDKLKDNGFYVIGRITTFKDSFYVTDNKEDSIKDVSGNPYNHNGSYWPSAYNRNVWEYNVKLAIEAVTLFGFNEIQFDYVRFPDGTGTLEKNGTINYNNTYDESKAEALQTFLMYACDNIHKHNAYVSVDVFGESANSYVTAYGQYWGAMSNIVDVISGMPYPDHFNTYEYGFTVPVWTVPYELLKTWGLRVMARQKEVPTPATVRTWIQAYNAIKAPYITYDATKIKEEIEGLYKAGLTGGYMTWNGSSSLSKYTEIASAFKEDYLN